jgi:hypothetical protein
MKYILNIKKMKEDDASFGNLFTKGGLPVASFRSDRTGFPEVYKLIDIN